MIVIFHKIKNRFRKAFGILGPGFVTGSADDDPSGIGTYSLAGAKFGLLMAWLIPFQLPLMFAMQEMCARIGLATGKGLTTNMKQFLPRFFLYGAVLLLAIANIINIGADIVIMAASARLLFGYQLHIWAIAITTLIILVAVFIPYHFYSKVLIVLSFFLVAYAITAFLTVHDWMEIGRKLLTPHILWNKDFILVMTGVIGTTISPYLFFWQSSQEIEEEAENNRKGNGISRMTTMKKDTFIGSFFSQLMALCILLTCYATLHLHGITEITSAYGAARALEPLAGELAFVIFALGIIAAGALGISVLAGSSAYALSELFNKRGSLAYKFKDAKFFYAVIAFSTLIGLGMHFVGLNPIQALLYAAVFNCIAAVPFVALVIIIANKKQIMGAYVNGFWSNLGGVITLATMTAAAVLVLLWH